MLARPGDLTPESPAVILMILVESASRQPQSQRTLSRGFDKLLGYPRRRGHTMVVCFLFVFAHRMSMHPIEFCLCICGRGSLISSLIALKMIH